VKDYHRVGKTLRPRSWLLKVVSGVQSGPTGTDCYEKIKRVIIASGLPCVNRFAASELEIFNEHGLQPRPEAPKVHPDPQRVGSR
jgi:hypothetical protein